MLLQVTSPFLTAGIAPFQTAADRSIRFAVSNGSLESAGRVGVNVEQAVRLRSNTIGGPQEIFSRRRMVRSLVLGVKPERAQIFR
jgi:hypothetical protein